MKELESSSLHLSRLSRELKTIRAMVKIYCRKHHLFQVTGVCKDCSLFLKYAEQRLSHCPFGEQKPTCGKCTIHCYKNVMQDKAKIIMRYSGPRILWHHPIMAFFHLLDGRREVPDLQSCRKDKKAHQLK